MRKYLKSFSVFLLLAILFIGIIIVIDGFLLPRQLGGNLIKYDNDFDYSSTRLKEAENTNNVDLLILGSSHAYRGYDVRKFQGKGLKTLNLGTSSQTLIQTEFLLKKYIDNLNPKYVILDVYAEIMNSDGVESTTKLLSVMDNDPRLSEIALQTKDIRAYETLWFHYIKNSIIDHEFPEDQPSEQGTYIEGGYLKSDRQVNLPSTYKSRELEASKDQLQALAQITELLTKRDIPYIILHAPIQKERYLSYVNSLDSVFESYGTYYDYNEVGFLPENCFLDSHHINSNGVEIYDEWVLKKLESIVPKLQKN